MHSLIEAMEASEIFRLKPQQPLAPFGHVRLADGMTFAPGEKKHMLSSAGIEELEAEMLRMEGSTTCERLDLKLLFAPGICIREIFMPAGELVMGAIHNFEHFNTVLCGRASVIMGGKVHEIVGPSTFLSGAGVRKTLWIHEDCRWQTIHPNPENETDRAVLESKLVSKSAAYVRHFADMKTLQALFTERSSQ